MKKYGESIYGTRGGPFRAPDERTRKQGGYFGRFALPVGRWWGGSTHKDNVIYLHVLRWPGDTIVLPPISRKIVSHSLLGGGTAVVEQTDQRITVAIAAESRDPLDSIVKLQLDGRAAGIKLGRLPSESLAFGKKATASNVFQNSAEFQPAMAVDDDFTTRWGCDWGTHSAWLAVDLGEAKAFERALISEPYGRVQQFELQAKQSDRWVTIQRGTTIGEGCLLRFPSVTARHVRLNLLKTSEGPSIWEFQLFQAPR